MTAWRSRGRLAIAVVALVLVSSACGASDDPATTSPGSATPTVIANRPASSAKLKILTPKNGQTIHGTTTQMNVSLKDAEIVPATSTDIVPDEGHLHVILDDQLISMTGETTQVLSNLTSGPHLLKVEFVASDHAPFDPRVIAAVSFEVQP